MAISLDVASRHPNHFIVFGDSRLADIYGDSFKYKKQAKSFFNQANARLGQRMRVVGHYAVSGQLQAQYLSAQNLSDGIKTDAKWALIFGITNDVAADNSVDYFNTITKPACELLIAAGITPILITEAGSGAYAAVQNSRFAVHKYNTLIKQYAQRARAYGRVLCFDLASIVLDLTSTTIAMKSGYSGDITHYLVNAAVPAGIAFAQFIQSIGVPALPLRKVSAGETRTLGIQAFTNPGFITTTGGALGAFTGTAPLGMTNGVLDAGVSCAVSSTTNADGSKDIILTASSTGAGRAQMAMDIAAGLDAPGDTWDVTCQATIASGAVNLQSAYLWAQYNQTTNVPNSIDYGDMFSTHGSDGTGVLAASQAETLDYAFPVLIPPGTRGYWTVRYIIAFGGAGSATVNLRHLAVDKRLN